MKRAVRVKVRLLAMLRRDTDRCIFCNNSPTTYEHIFPRWTHRYLGARRPGRAKSLIGVECLDRAPEMTIGALPGDYRDWQIKCVCEGCNGGWMKDIEDAAIPVMTPLLLGKRRRLLPKDYRVIASWAIRKSMVMHHAIVHHMRRKQFKRRTGLPPRGWGVWIELRTIQAKWPVG